MTKETRATQSNAIASQVAELANAAVVEKTHRQKASAERRKQTAKVDAWLSKDRMVLIAFLLALPLLALVVTVNVMDKSLAELFTSKPGPQVSQQLAQESLDAMVKRIDSFHDDYDALPTNLAEVGLPPQGDWTWAPRGAGQYSVTVKMFGQSLTFDTRQR